MKARNILIFLLGALIAPIYLTSCGEDRWAEYAIPTRTDRWIDDTMRVHYYWYQDIPNSNRLNYFLEPANFFTSLLSKKDGKGGRPYSTIDSLLPANTRSIPYTDYSYGFQFELARVANNDTAYYAHILYVAKNSPASTVKLERGEWIMAMNSKPITKKNAELLYGSSAMNLTVGYYDIPKDTIIAYKDPVAIAAARTIDDNPVFYYNTYIREDKRIGYLVYNHFSAGPTAGSDAYNNSLREATQYFASKQVNEFILDLRYNNGGAVSCAQLLSTLLAPAADLGKELGYLEFNDHFNPPYEFINLETNLIQNGANLNLKKLYVLTSAQTASASEMVINCLKPYMEVYLIGGTTEGKNVGSRSFANQELMIVLHPIVCKIYNSRQTSDYEAGFKPDYAINENSNMARFLPFGNENELLLGTALSIIDGTLVPKKPVAPALQKTAIFTSINRRATNAVQIK